MKYAHLPLELREQERLFDLNEYLSGKIDLRQLKAREQGTDRWQASRMLMQDRCTVAQYQAIEPSYKTDYVAAFLDLASNGMGKR